MKSDKFKKAKEATEACDNSPALEQKITMLEQKLAEQEAVIKDLKLRQLAENDNRNKMHKKQLEQSAKYATEKFAKDMLQIIDAMHMAATAITPETDQNLAKGIEMAITVMLKTLDQHGIKPIKTEGIMDPELHIAVKIEESEQKANTIISTLQQGYTMHDRVLRPASVVVAG